MLTIENDGPLIVSSNYWGGPLDKAGSLYLSVNTGAFRLLLPTGWEKAVEEMRTAKEVVISRGPFAGQFLRARGRDSLELLFDDGSAEPYAIHLDATQCDRLPLPEDQGKERVFTAWTMRDGKPYQLIKLPCWYRVVPAIPCLKARGES